MEKSIAETETNTPKQEGEKLQRKIAAAKRRRSKLLAAIEENPSKTNKNKLTRLEKIIESDSDKLHFLMIEAASPSLGYLLEILPRVIASQDEKELLELGEEAFAATVLKNLRVFRNEIFDSTMLLSKNESVKTFMRRVDETISEGETKLEEKRKNAADRFPELARKHRLPDYEMPAEYNKILQFLTEQIERRDKAAKNLVNVHPNKRKKFMAMIAESNKIINEAERKLAEIYEAHQKKRRYLEGLRKLLASGSNTERYQMREYLKEHPGELPDVEKVMREDFPDEDDD